MLRDLLLPAHVPTHTSSTIWVAARVARDTVRILLPLFLRLSHAVIHEEVVSSGARKEMKRYSQMEHTRRTLSNGYILFCFCLDISITRMCQIGTVNALDVCKRMTFLIVLKWSADQQMITLRCLFPWAFVRLRCGRYLRYFSDLVSSSHPLTAEMNEFNCSFPRCKRCTFPHLSPCI